MERIDPKNVHPYVWADHLHRYKWATPLYHGNVLDFACGVGYGSQFVLEAKQVDRYVGADLSLDALEFARGEYTFPRVFFVNAHSDHLPFQPYVFDTIICFETLEHVNDPENLVSQFLRLLKPDGVLVGSVPSRQQEELIDQIYGENPYHKTRFDLSSLKFLLSKYFRVIWVAEQSLVAGSILRPLENFAVEGSIVRDRTLADFPPGNLVFVASNQDFQLPFSMGNFSFVYATSVFEIDRQHNDRIRSLEHQLSELKGDNGRLNLDLESANARLVDLEQALEQVRREKEATQNLLDEINRSRYWRLIRWLWRQPLYLKIRNVLLAPRRQSNTSITNNVTSPDLSDSTTISRDQTAMVRRAASSTQESRRFSDEEQKWLEKTLSLKPEAITVLHPEWRGIHASAEQMFDVLLEIPDNLDPASAVHYADLIAETACSRIVISGFPVSYRYLILALRKRLGDTRRLYAIYHGQYNQYREDYDRLSYSTLLNLAKAGLLDKIGFVKAGMAEVVHAATGVSTGFVMNWVERIPEAASVPMDGGPHLGLWLLWSGNWRKPPFSMLAASLLIPGSIIHGADADERVREYITLMNIRAEFAGRPLPQAELLEQMEKMHLNLYVTFHECAPMLPLESLSVGTPCLFSPVSHYFEDEPYLHQRLVVPYPERAEVIATFAQRAIEERTEIVKAYQKYAPAYNRRARESLMRFLDLC